MSERHARDAGEKYLWFEHAERNSIYNAARSGTTTAGCRMYVNSFPCADCARAIVQSGVTQLNTFAFDPKDEKFGRHFIVASEMLIEAGVEVKMFARDDSAITAQADLFIETRNTKNGFLR